MTPLYWAADKGNAPVVRALLALGAAATTKSLAHAVEHPEIVRLLLVAGAPPGGLVRVAAGAEIATPLMAAARASSLESVRLLLDSGADGRIKNRNCLRRARPRAACPRAPAATASCTGCCSKRRRGRDAA